MFEHELFRKQIYCIEESTCNMLCTCDSWDFLAPPAVIRRPGIVLPLPPSLRLWTASGGK